MRYFFLLLCVFLAVSLSAQDSIPSATYINGKKYEGYIFPKEYLSFMSIENQKDRFTPSLEDISVCEKLINKNLGYYMDRNDIYSGGTPIYRILPHYKRQYVGFVNDKGEKIIWINFLKYADFDLSKDIAVVLDGGSNFWSIYVNITTRELFGMQVNGVA